MSYRNESKQLFGKVLAKVAMDYQRGPWWDSGRDASDKGRRGAALHSDKGEGWRKVLQVKGICQCQVGIRAYLCVRQNPAEGKHLAAFLR